MLLDKAAKGILQSDDIQYIKDNLKSVKKSLMTLKKKADTNLAKLEKHKTAVLNKIKAYRQRLDKALDKLEEVTIKEIDQAAERAKVSTGDDKKLYADTVSTLDAVLNMVVKTKGKDISEAAIFVGVKRAKQKMVESERIISFTRNMATQEALRFIPDTRLMDWIKSLKQLGSFSHQQRSYSGSLIGKYNIRSEKDSGSCDVFGCDFLPDGRLLLSDWDNQCVKLLDHSYSVIDQCALTGNPLAVCCINPEAAVVSLTMKKKLQFVSLTTTTVTAENTVATDDNCRGLAYHDGQIFVLCGGFKTEGEGHISIYSTTGQPLNTIKTNNVNQRIFASPISIAIDTDGMFYHVTDGQRGVITLTPSSDVVSMLSCPDMTWPCGICMDREGNALICNGKSNNVIQMSTLSKFMKVLSYEDGVKTPRAVCFDPNNVRLIVTNRGNHIAVYQLVARGISDVAKDVKPTIPTVEATENSNAATSDPDKEGEKKSKPSKAIENNTKQNENKENAEENKMEHNAPENLQEKKKEKGTDQKKAASFTTMTEKLKQSQQALKTITDVSTANTSPENRPKSEEKGNKKETKETLVNRRASMDIPSARQSREKSVVNRQATRQSKEDLRLNFSHNGYEKDPMATSQSSTRKQSITSTLENKLKDSSNRSSKRPQTASMETTRKGNGPKTSSSPVIKKVPTPVNSISLRSKENTESATKMHKTNSRTSLTAQETKDQKPAEEKSKQEMSKVIPKSSSEEGTVSYSEEQLRDALEKNKNDNEMIMK